MALVRALRACRGTALGSISSSPAAVPSAAGPCTETCSRCSQEGRLELGEHVLLEPGVWLTAPAPARIRIGGGTLPQPRRAGRGRRARRDRRALHVRQRLLRHRRQPPLRRPRQARAVAGLHLQGPDPDRRQRLVRRQRRDHQRRHDRRALRDRRQLGRDDRPAAVLDRRGRAREGPAARSSLRPDGWASNGSRVSSIGASTARTTAGTRAPARSSALRRDGRDADRARAAQGARRRDDPRGRLGDRRARRRARRGRAQRRREVDAAAAAGRDRPARPRHGAPDGAAPPATCRRSPTARPASACSDYLARRTGVAAADARVHDGHRRDGAPTRPARGGLRARVRGAGSRSAAPTSSRGPRPCCATSGWTRRCSSSRPRRSRAAQAARAALAAILLSRFDVLLLDEPTNDLDFDGLARLERFVAERPGGAVIVSARPRVPRAHGHARARDRRDRAHRGGVRRRLGGLPGAAATAARHAEERYETFATAARPARRTARAASASGRRPACARPRRATSRTRTSAARARSARRSRRRRCARPRRRSSACDEVDKPWRRWELQLRFGGGERSGDVTARLEGARDAARRASSSARSTSSWRGASAPRSSGPTAAARRRSSRRCSARLPLAAGTRWVGPGVRIGTLDQARAGFDGEASLLDAFVARSGLTQQEARSLLAKFGLESDAVARAAGSALAGRAHAREPRAADGLGRELARPRRADQPPRPAGDRAARDRARRLRRHAAARHARPPAARGGRAATARSRSAPPCASPSTSMMCTAYTTSPPNAANESTAASAP